jgi:hypothetical protein
MPTIHNFSFGIQQQISRTIINTAMDTRQGVVTADALSDPRFSGQQSVIFNVLRSMMCAPLLARNRLIGAIYVDNRIQKGVFDEATIPRMRVSPMRRSRWWRISGRRPRPGPARRRRRGSVVDQDIAGLAALHSSTPSAGGGTGWEQNNDGVAPNTSARGHNGRHVVAPGGFQSHHLHHHPLGRFGD